MLKERARPPPRIPSNWPELTLPLPVSESFSGNPPLSVAVQLVRLRDRLAAKWDYEGWLGPMVALEEETRKAATSVAREKTRARQKPHGRETVSLAWRAGFFQRDFDLWNDLFLSEANTIAKFLEALAGIPLDVSGELNELKRLTQRNELANGRIDGFLSKLTATGTGNGGTSDGEGVPIYRDLLGIAGSLEVLKAEVGGRADDVIRLVGLMSGEVEGQALLDLLTGEP